MIKIPTELGQQLAVAQHIVVLTGAGISAESGIPTFREAQTGLWARYDPQELATPGAFRRNPALVWDWYTWRRQLVAKAAPNAGHIALANLAQKVPKMTLVTQNVDNLHQDGGSRDVIELHGNLTRSKCFDNGHIVAPAQWTPAPAGPPHCPHCGGLMRPDVVWFGEMLPSASLEAALAAAKTCDLMLSVGTSTTVQPAATIPFLASRHGAVTVEINPQPTPFTAQADYALSGPAAEVLPLLVKLAFAG